MWYTDIAKKRPLGAQTEPRLTRKNKIIIHTMVGSLWGTDSYFMRDAYGGTESHFGVGYDGEILQWQDDEYQADANLEGNDDCISIENADKGDGFAPWTGENVPAFTPAQVEANALILARVATRHNIPLVLISNTEDATRGIGYHRQGIDPYRTHGEEYSTAYGKICPGNRRVAQIPTIIARARQLAAGGGTTPTPEDWFDMATKADLLEVVVDAMTAVADSGSSFRSDMTQLTANGVDRAMSGTNVPAKVALAAGSGVWGAWFGRDENRKSAATVLAEIAAKVGVPVEVNEQEIAADLAALVLPEMKAAVVAAVKALPGSPAEDIAGAVVDLMSKRLGVVTGA